MSEEDDADKYNEEERLYRCRQTIHDGRRAVQHPRARRHSPRNPVAVDRSFLKPDRAALGRSPAVAVPGPGIRRPQHHPQHWPGLGDVALIVFCSLALTIPRTPTTTWTTGPHTGLPANAAAAFWPNRIAGAQASGELRADVDRQQSSKCCSGRCTSDCLSTPGHPSPNRSTQP
ncbi:MAG: hypothetical protein JWM76_2141 [Pseudonocardiales bacterium]|nr:hypothetical protein [Pseudonocardiales bacterium]